MSGQSDLEKKISSCFSIQVWMLAGLALAGGAATGKMWVEQEPVVEVMEPYEASGEKEQLARMP